jgi:hypothetical protein
MSPRTLRSEQTFIEAAAPRHCHLRARQNRAKIRAARSFATRLGLSEADRVERGQAARTA